MKRKSESGGINLNSLDKLGEAKPELKAIFELLIKKQLEMERNMDAIVSEHKTNQKFKQGIWNLNMQLVEKAKQ